MSPGKSIKIRIDKGAGNLSGPVRPEVEKDHRITLRYGGHRPALLSYHTGKHKFIGVPRLIGGFHGGDSRSHGHAAAKGHSVISLLYSVPTLVAIHRIVAAHNGGNLAEIQLTHPLLQLNDVVLAAGGGNIPAVHEAMNVHILQALILSKFDQSHQVIHVAVYAAVGHQAHQVELATAFLGAGHRIQESLIGKKISIVDSLADTSEFLIHDAARTDVEMAHFGVTHLALGQTHIQTTGMNGGGGVLLDIFFNMGNALLSDGIAFLIFADAKAVQNQKRSHFLHSWSPICRS